MKHETNYFKMNT